jgi:hypothetical protein
MLFDGEHGTDTGPFVAPQLFHPFLVGDGGAVQRIAGFPRLEPGIVAPANLVPLVIVGTRQRAQTHRDAHAMRLDEFRHFKGIMSLKDCKIVTLPLCPTHTPCSVFHAIEPWYNERYGHV